VIFVIQISRLRIVRSPVSNDKMRVLVVTVVGPLFFGTVNSFNMELENLDGVHDLILSLRTCRCWTPPDWLRSKR
jgi:MFS superfamily sulfate permease-like transporter